MNKCSQLFEEMEIHRLYCSDHMFHLTSKKLHEDITYEEGGIVSMAVHLHVLRNLGS